MTPEQIQADRKMIDAATPGGEVMAIRPGVDHIATADEAKKALADMVDENIAFDGANRDFMAVLAPNRATDSGNNPLVTVGVFGQGPDSEANAHFYAAARTRWPAALSPGETK